MLQTCCPTSVVSDVFTDEKRREQRKGGSEERKREGGKEGEINWTLIEGEVERYGHRQ